MRYLRGICRLIFGAAFILSGFLKVIDPMGSALKIKEYFGAFHISFMDFMSVQGAVLLATIEFIAGVAILKGLRINFFSKLALLFISFFTLLTLVIVIFDPVSDCGCFGEAIHIGNTATFVKNIVLLLAALLIFFQRDKIIPMAKPKVEWLYIIAYAALILWLQIFTLRNVPVIDFGLYKPGTDLLAAQNSNQEREYETIFIYEKDGVQQNFTLDNLPDSTWTFIDAKSHLVSGQTEDKSLDISFSNQSGEVVTEQILQFEGPLFIVSIYDAESLNDRFFKRVRTLEEVLKAHNVELYILSSGIDNFPNSLIADYKAIISLNRSNGGLTYLNDGVIVRKWSRNHYPIASIGEILESDPETVTAKVLINERLFAEISLIVIFFLIALIKILSRLQKRNRVKNQRVSA